MLFPFVLHIHIKADRSTAQTWITKAAYAINDTDMIRSAKFRTFCDVGQVRVELCFSNKVLAKVALQPEMGIWEHSQCQGNFRFGRFCEGFVFLFHCEMVNCV